MKFQTRHYGNSHQNKMDMLAKVELTAINIQTSFFTKDAMNPLSKYEIFLLHIEISYKFDVVEYMYSNTMNFWYKNTLILLVILVLPSLRR